MMKLYPYLLLPTLCFFCHSCVKTDQPDPNDRPVNLPKPLEFETYFVKSTTLTQQLLTTGTATVKIKFNGSAIPPLPHNVKQGQSIAWATSRPQLSDKLFYFTLSGLKASLNQREPLLEYLSNSGVRLQQIKIRESNLENNPTVVEDMMANKLNIPDLITVTINRIQ